MLPAFSLYLDLIRFLAALCVFLDHISSEPFTKDLLWPRVGAYGDLAVIVFFVLSGFVIAHVTATKEKTASAYFLARGSRLYSVVLLALPLTFIADRLGGWFNPEFYALQKVMWKPESLQGYLASLFFLNEYQIFGFEGLSPGTNAPWWSLSFEATYYVLAGLLLFAPRRICLIAAPAILLLAGRTIAILAPLWALGFGLYHFAPARTYSRKIWTLGTVAGLGVLFFAPELFGDFDNFGWRFPWGCGAFNRNLAQDYGGAGAFSLHLISMRALLTRKRAIAPFMARMIRSAGALTFPLYCFHYPLLCFFSAISPFRPDRFTHFAFVASAVLLCVWALAPLCDRLRKTLRMAAPFRRARLMPEG